MSPHRGGNCERRRRRSGLPAALVTLAAIVALAGCGGGDGDPELTVFAASSLQGAFREYARSFPGVEVRQSFAGSDQLAAQIRAGVEPDVYAAASTEYPDELHREGLVEKPTVFAANRLVIAVPAASGVSSLADLAEPGVKLVIGDPDVPVGSYTRELLGRLPAAERRAILANVRSEEPEVSSIAAKLAAGVADAGFVYATDVAAAGADLRTVALPARLEPDVAYGVAVVAGTPHADLARRFLAGLLRGRGAAELRAAGFLSPP